MHDDDTRVTSSITAIREAWLDARVKVIAQSVFPVEGGTLFSQRG